MNRKRKKRAPKCRCQQDFQGRDPVPRVQPPLHLGVWQLLTGALPDQAAPSTPQLPQPPSKLGGSLPGPTPSHARSISSDKGCQRNAARLEKLQQFMKIASCHSTPLTSTPCSHKHNSQPREK